MKKILSFVCAIAIALCASATQIAPKAELAKKAPVAVEQMQKVQAAAQFKQVPAMNANQLSAAKALKVTNLAPQTMMEPKDMAAQRRSVVPRKEQQWGEWADFAPFGVNTGKYTFATLGADIQTGVQVLERKDNTGLKQYTLKNWGKGYFGVTGTDLILNMNADNTFTFTSNVVNVGVDVYFADYASATGDPSYASLNSYNPETGVFNFYTAILMVGSKQIYTAAQETFVMDKPITERDTVDIVSTNLQYNDLITQNGVVIFYVSDVEGYRVFRVTSNATAIDGTFKWSENTINDPNSYFSVSGTDKTYFQDGEFTMVTTDAGTSLTGWMIGTDEKYYRLNWSKKAGVLDYDANAPFEAEFAYGEMSATLKDGVIIISATNAEKKAIGLELYTDPTMTTIPSGTYVISDSQEAGTALKSTGMSETSLTKCWAGTLDEEGYVNVPCWFIVDGTITLSYDEYDKLKVEVDGTNSFGQPVKATVKYTKLDPKSEVTIEADNMTFEGDGTSFQLVAANEDYDVVLTVMSNDTAGTYGIEDLISNYSAIYSIAGQVSILDGEFTLAVDGKNMTLTGSLLASDTIQYNLNITGYMGALPRDQETDFEATFELEKAEVQSSSTTTTLTVINDNNQLVALAFFAEADGKKLPAGTYPINSTRAENTVRASQGFTTSGFTYSFAAETNDQGQIANPWWMVGGEVVVAEDGSITINAVNSYDKTVTITITAPATGLFDVNVKANVSKFMHNGRLFIRKGEKTYNALGF